MLCDFVAEFCITEFCYATTETKHFSVGTSDENLGGADHLVGLAFLPLFFILDGYWALLGLFSLPMLATAISQKCGINKLLGINSCRI